MAVRFRRHLTHHTLGGAAISVTVLSGLLGCQAAPSHRGPAAQQAPPNVVLLLTDDLGYGDLGRHGNPEVKTPNIDGFAEEGLELEHFYVTPMCAPTRASLLTGRYNLRTGVVDTGFARTNLKRDEIIIAQMFKDAGYRTAMFGKWHIGPNYPMRPEDKGFDEVVLRALGVVDMPDAADRATRRFDPVFRHNGKAQKYKGFSQDILTDEAIAFITKNRNRPFFVYFPTNLPHLPNDIPDEYADPYRMMGLGDDMAGLYGTITNVDDNFGRLLGALDSLRLTENTIVIFTSDNGPSVDPPGRFLAGLRGTKSTVYEGGIRVPFFIRWPGKVPGGRKVQTAAAHIDVVPTLLEACGVPGPRGVHLDGRSLVPLLTEPDESKVAWPDRTLFFQWHRGDRPEQYRAFALRGKTFKLVQAVGYRGKEPASEFRYELFDLLRDPGEANDLAGQHPELVDSMKQEYDDWFKDVTKGQSYEAERIDLGTRHENPVILTRINMRGITGVGDTDLGYWPVDCRTSGRYQVTSWLPANPAIKGRGKAYFRFNDTDLILAIDAGARKAVFEDVRLNEGTGGLEAWLEFGPHKLAPTYVDVRWIE
jgi:arylsulfatase A-like enzyme